MVEKFGETDSNLFLEKLCFEYAAELSREACLSPCSLVVALIYLDRLCQTNPNFVSSIPSSKLFLISVVRTFFFLVFSRLTSATFSHIFISFRWWLLNFSMMKEKKMKLSILNGLIVPKLT